MYGNIWENNSIQYISIRIIIIIIIIMSIFGL